MAITQTELSSILAEVEQDLRKAHDVEVEKLSKGFPPGQDESPADASPEAADASSPADESASAPPAAPAAGPDASAGGPPPDASAAPAPGMDPAAGAPEGQAPMTPEALQAEYAQLPPEELDMHIQAALAAKEALSGAAGAPPAEGSMPPGAAEGSMPPPAAMKGEIKVDKEAIGGPSTMKSEPSEFIALAKSQEKLIKALVEAQAEKDSKIQGLTEDVENLTQAIGMVVGKPMRKSIANLSEINVVAKTSQEVAPMAKSEVYKLVGDNADKLTKSERDLWLGFIDNKVPAAKLAPMLERLTSQK